MVRSPGSVPQSTPVQVAGSFTNVSTGSQHTCAIGSSGGAFCWGENTFYNLGNGGLQNAATPQAVIVSGGSPLFRTISVGNGHSCATDNTGAVWCWGLNEMGQMGNGTWTTPDGHGTNNAFLGFPPVRAFNP
jgi:alpha-tubulin suppressor-like RCC1 family protein